MRKSELLKAIQSEINRHGLDTFSVRVDNGNIVTPGCPLCRKTLYTTSNFIDHINHDVLPPLLDRLSQSENAEPPDEDFIDTDYCADPERKIRRKSGEQDVILPAICNALMDYAAKRHEVLRQAGEQYKIDDKSVFIIKRY